jgi:hypothetical protein
MVYNQWTVSHALFELMRCTKLYFLHRYAARSKLIIEIAAATQRHVSRVQAVARARR